VAAGAVAEPSLAVDGFFVSPPPDSDFESDLASDLEPDSEPDSEAGALLLDA